MKDANLWDFNERKYFKTQIPDGCKTFAIDMDEEVICPDCLETLKYGDGYTSLRWHGSGGIGYTVCEKCYEMEKELARLANSRNKRHNQDTGWRTFDEEDETTWPEMESERESKAVLVCDRNGDIYIGYIWGIHRYNNSPEWRLTNCTSDVCVPLYCVTAWKPLPEPYKEDT